MIASFRNLDAVYKIKKSTGKIVWKLGGTRTPKSLTVKHDPHNYTLGAQHDARLLPDGTLTLFDNRTKLRAQNAAGSALPDQPKEGNGDAPEVDHRPATSAPPTAAARPGAYRIETG